MIVEVRCGGNVAPVAHSFLEQKGCVVFLYANTSTVKKSSLSLCVCVCVPWMNLR